MTLSGIGGVLKWAGIAGAGGSLLFRYVEPVPRWDVLACVGVALGGLLISWAADRRAEADAARTAPHGAHPQRAHEPLPASPPGFRLRPDGRLDHVGRRRAGGMLLVAAVAVLMWGSASHVTPQLADARAGSARVDPVTVDRVISSHTRKGSGRGGPPPTTYGLKLVVGHDETAAIVPGDGVYGTLKTHDSISSGDRLWALHNPSRNDDVQLAQNRSELTDLQDGSTRPSAMLLGFCGALAALALTLLLRRPHNPNDDSGASVTEALRTGDAQAQAVTLRGTMEAGRRWDGVALRLLAEDGQHPFHPGRQVDAEHLADELWGRTAWLYWERPDGAPPEDRAPIRQRQMPAVLVVGDGATARYVRGWMPRRPVGQGVRLGQVEPASCPEVRQFDAGALRKPRTRLGAVVWLGLAALVSLAPMVVPTGRPEGNLLEYLVFAVVPCTVVGLRMIPAKARPDDQRQQRREATAAGYVG